jgi:hypothetical protein
MASRRFREACPMFAESQRLDPGGGTLLNLAVCHEGDGKTATAWSEFNQALSLAIKDGRKDREQLARQRLTFLEPELSHLTIVVPPESQVNGITVALDGVAVGSAAWGVPATVDPGTHRVQASAPLHENWSVLVIIGESADAKRIQVPPLTPDTGAAPAVSAQPSSTPTTAPDAKMTAHTTVASKSAARYIVGGLGVAALIGSAVTGIMALHDHSVVNDNCLPDRQYCSDPNGVSAASDGKTWAWVSTGALAAGLAGVAAFLLWPRDTVPITVGAAPWPGGGSLVVGGVY